MRTILVALAVTISDDSPTPAGVVEAGDLLDYINLNALEAVVVAVADRSFPENNVEPQIFKAYEEVIREYTSRQCF